MKIVGFILFLCVSVCLWVWCTKMWVYIYIYIYEKYIYLYNQKLILSIYIYIIMLCRQHGYPWPSLATSPYRSSPLAGLQSYIPYPHIAAECMFKPVILLLPGHTWGSIGVHHLWARPCFSIMIKCQSFQARNSKPISEYILIQAQMRIDYMKFYKVSFKLVVLYYCMSDNHTYTPSQVSIPASGILPVLPHWRVLMKRNRFLCGWQYICSQPLMGWALKRRK